MDLNDGASMAREVGFGRVRTDMSRGRWKRGWEGANWVDLNSIHIIHFIIPKYSILFKNNITFKISIISFFSTIFYVKYYILKVGVYLFEKELEPSRF